MLARTLHAPILTTMSAAAIEDTMADVRKTDAAIIEELNAALKESKRIEEANIKFPSDSSPEVPRDNGIRDFGKATVAIIGKVLFWLSNVGVGISYSRILKAFLFMEAGPTRDLEVALWELLATLCVCIIALMLLIKTESKAKRGEGRVDNTPKVWTMSPKFKQNLAIFGTLAGGIGFWATINYFTGGPGHLHSELMRFIAHVIVAVVNAGGDGGYY